jgi:hypothetical protein
MEFDIQEKIYIVDLQRYKLDDTYYLFDKLHYNRKGFNFIKQKMFEYID